MNGNPPHFCAALIAGGNSSRMGRDKRLIEFNGKPLWRRQIEILQSLQPAELVISGPLAGPWPAGDYRVIPDGVDNAGPLAGIATVLKSVASSLVLALAVDMPRMTADYLRSLLDKCAENRGVVPVRGELFEPLAAIYPRACSRMTDPQLASGKFTLQSFVQACADAGMLKPVEIASEEEWFFQNLNQPDDLVRADRIGK